MSAARDPYRDRTPPYSEAAEQAVLSAMLLDSDARLRATEYVDESRFYRESHRRVFRAMLSLSERGEVIDPLTLTEELARKSELEAAGGREYIAYLVDVVPTAANVEYHAKIVREKALRRRLIEVSTSIVSEAFDSALPAAELLDAAEHSIFEVNQSRGTEGFTRVKELMYEAMERIEQLHLAGESVTGVPSGFRDLDEITAGFQPSELVIIAARPSMGKCLAHDAEIVMEDGSIETIESIYRGSRQRMLTLDDSTLEFSLVEPSAYIDDGIKPAFRVTTRLGRSIETTVTHPFRTFSGWQPLGELAPGDRIAVPARINVFGKNRARDCDVKLLGYALGSALGDVAGATGGTWSADSNASVRRDFLDAAEAARSSARTQQTALTGFAGADIGRAAYAVQHASREPWARFPTALDESGSGAAPVSFSCPDTPDCIARWLTDSSGALQDAQLLELPRFVFTLERKQVALLLNRMFASGCEIIPARGRTQLRLSAPAERLARQVQHLLLRFGIVASVSEHVPERAGDWRAEWAVEITDARAIGKFASDIGILGREEQLERAAQLAGSSRLSTADDRGAALPECEVYWDEIVSIESAGMKQVYDLTIPDTHNFVANDICVHNTAFVLNIAQNAALDAKTPVAFFSLEMSKQSLLQRMLTSEARVDAQRLRKGKLRDDEFVQLGRAAGLLSQAPVWIDDTPAISLLEMRSKARRLKAENNIGMIVVDYLQLMVGPPSSENRQQEISTISRSLKALARELRVPVIALSQLSRAPEQRAGDNKRPQLSDLRESGAIEQDADVVMFLYRQEYYDVLEGKDPSQPDKDGKTSQGLAEVIIGKQRNGPTGNVTLFFNRQYTRFENYSGRQSGGGQGS
jgi:replicative DNA helicase